MNTLFKTPAIKSKKIRRSAKGEPCTIRSQYCNHNRQTTVLAHLNSWFKGIGNKSPDIISCYACAGCHAALDAGKISYRDQLRAWQETIMRFYQKDLINVN